MSSPGAISVVIRVRNEGPALHRVLCALKVQDVPPLEIIVVDNASTDESRAVAQYHGAMILDISQAEFTYGRALNMGIRKSQGEFVCILSAHSLPIGRDFLRTAIAPFDDPRVAAVRCLSVTSRVELENWTTPSVLEWPIDMDVVITSAPVNCASLVRRSVWEQIPYEETLTGVEDKFWAFQVLKDGFRICNSPALYLYLRDLTFYDRLRKLTRDRQEFFRKTGRQWQQPSVSLRDLIVTTFYSIPRRALRQVAYEAALYVSLKSIPYRVKRMQKSV